MKKLPPREKEQQSSAPSEEMLREEEVLVGRPETSGLILGVWRGGVLYCTVQSLRGLWFFVTPWTAAGFPALDCLPSLLKLTSWSR